MHLIKRRAYVVASLLVEKKTFSFPSAINLTVYFVRHLRVIKVAGY